jgi:methylated-DNA-[protein]-cysteine S-methyltransferase
MGAIAQTIADFLPLSQYIAGFQGDWQKVPSGQNCEKKLKLLREEGVLFDGKGMLLDKSRWWYGFKV